MNLSDVITQLQTLQQDFVNHLKDFHMSENANNIATEAATGAVGAVEIAASTQQAVAQQGTLLAKIEAGLGEFLTLAPSVADAMMPAEAATINAVASVMTTLLGVIKAIHPATAQNSAAGGASAPVA